MNKEKFIKYINIVQTQLKKDVEFCENMGKAFKNCFQANLMPDNELIIEAFIDLLVEVVNDEEKWIEYFIYELDFGVKNSTMKIYDAQGKEIRLSNAAHLYDIINRK